MVQTNVENEPISIQLSDGESTTVPSGETWKVTISLGLEYDQYTDGVELHINGTTVSAYYNDSDGAGGPTPTVEAVLSGGDTLKVTGGGFGCGAHISGFVVN